jgi:hypothetical protein
MWQDGSGEWHITDEEVNEMGTETTFLLNKIKSIGEILDKYEGLDQQDVIDLIAEIRGELSK